jgi:hypothetical protein
MKKISVMLLLLLPLAGCSIEPIKPWERDLLAREKMQLVPDSLENTLDEHIYFSKEAAFGGQGVGGGGCGCN